LSGHGLNPSEPGRPTERRDPIVDGDELRRHAIPVRDGDGPPDGPGGRPPGGRGRRQDPLDEVAEAILDNESLRSDLEGDAAEELLDWTIRTAQGLVERHVELAADPVVAARTELRALRRTVRSINRLAGMDRRPTRREARRRRDLLLEIAPGLWGPQARPQRGWKTRFERIAWAKELATPRDRVPMLIEMVEELRR